MFSASLTIGSVDRNRNKYGGSYRLHLNGRTHLGASDNDYLIIINHAEYRRLGLVGAASKLKGRKIRFSISVGVVDLDHPKDGFPYRHALGKMLKYDAVASVHSSAGGNFASTMSGQWLELSTVATNGFDTPYYHIGFSISKKVFDKIKDQMVQKNVFFRVELAKQ